jgi:hypothetical protein
MNAGDRHKKSTLIHEAWLCCGYRIPYGGIIRIRFRVGALPHPLSLPHKLPCIIASLLYHNGRVLSTGVDELRIL